MAVDMTTGPARTSGAVVEPEVKPCGFCLRCVQACPSGALQYQEHMWLLNLQVCHFCRCCVQVCPNALINPSCHEPV